MRARRRRRKKRNIGIIEVMCIIAALLVVLLLIAYAVFSHLDQKKAQVSGNIVDRQEQTVDRTQYVDELLKDFHVGKTDYLVTDKKFALSGRWYQTIIDGNACYNTVTQGAMVYFQIRGTDGFDIQFIDRTTLETPYFAYIIDDGEPVRQTVSENHVALPDADEHNVTLVMDGMNEREDKWQGEIGFAFSDIDCGQGEMNGFIPKQKRVLFIGDSITEGCMTLGDEAVSTYNSATHSVSWYTAEALHAEPYFLGYGGSGIGESGSFNTTAGALDYLSANRRVSAEDYPDCDLIILNVGTNDYNTDDRNFLRGYESVLDKLHEHYPNVSIVCVIPYNQTHAKQIREIVSGHKWAYLMETEGITFDSNDGIHPNDSGARKIAGLMVDFISKNGIF